MSDGEPTGPSNENSPTNSGMSSSMTSSVHTHRLSKRKSKPTEGYGYEAPASYLEIEVSNPETRGTGGNKYTVYTVTTQTSLPIFKHHMRGDKVTVSRRYSDFNWLREEMQAQSHESKIVVPSMPGKAYTRQFKALLNQGEGIHDQGYVETRRRGLELFINRLAGHPLAQNQKSLHMFLFSQDIDRNYTPGVVDRS